MKKVFKILLIFLVIVAIALVSLFCYFFVGKTQVKDNITWGVDFSQSQAKYLKLNWKELYSAIIGDLGVKNIKLHTNWDLVETKRGVFNFSDTDWQISQAEHGPGGAPVKIIYVLGLKTGRWPECHTPAWTSGLSEKTQQTELLKYIAEVVQRYKNSKAITYWQVENEPLFKFGECPTWYYNSDDFLKTEVALVKSLDPSRKIIISDSGEQSSWFGAARIGDIVGVTMYRKVWAHITDTFGFGVYSFLNPVTYMRKAQIIQEMFGKDVICIELQAEPWTQEPLMQSSLQEQKKSMNLDVFKENIEFAKQTGMDKFYFWGVEWWYWLKTEKNQSAIWDEAKQLFNN